MGDFVEHQKGILEALWLAFGARQFDTSSVVGEANGGVGPYSAQLRAAFEAAMPSSTRAGNLKYKQVRGILTGLADQHFTTDQLGWWYLKPETAPQRSGFNPTTGNKHGQGTPK
jgi:hypothetical protein